MAKLDNLAENLGQDDDTTTRSMSKRRLRKLWVTVHRFIALSIGFLFVLLGLTGSVNVWHWELEELGLPVPEARASPAARISLDQIMDNIRKAHPQRQGQWMLFMPGYEREFVWAFYVNPDKSADELLRIQLDPGTAKIIGEHYWGQTLWTLIYSFHISLLTGEIWGSEIGMIVANTVSFLGLFLVISAASGLYLWWPRTGKFRKALSFKQGTSSPRFHFDLHRVTGFYGSTILIVLAFTGFSFGYEDYVRPVVDLVSPVKALHFRDPEGLKSKWTSDIDPIPIERAVAIADGIFPDAELRWLATPDGPEGVYAIEKRQPGEANRRRPRSKVWIDQYSGEALTVEDPKKFTGGETFFNLMWPLHNGEAFGIPGRILWCLTGLVPLVLYITGLTLWLRKRRARRLRLVSKRRC